MPAPGRATAIDPIRFTDFRPGISDNPGAGYKPESATRANTWRCIANRSGALVPLPWRFGPFTMPHEAANLDENIWVNGVYVAPMGLLPTVAAFKADQFPEHEVFFGTEWVEGGTHHHRLRRVRRYEEPGTAMDLLHDISWPDPGAIWHATGMQFGTTRSNRADNTIVGAPVVIVLWSQGSTHNYLLSFPDDQALASNTPFFKYQDNVFLLNFCCHQGRTVAQIATAYGQGVNTTTFMGENLQWSRVNNFGDWTPNADPAVAIHAFPQVFVEENPSGYAFIAAMSANELFAVKVNGGVNVTGDLDNPTVISLPMVAGSEMSHTPAVCELGVVYGNRTSGVWLWPHGDTSQLLSPQMDPGFWVLNQTDLDDFGGIPYSFARCDDWVLIPNNWIFDTNLKSWWRLEDPSVVAIRHFTAMSHFIYGSQSFYTGNDHWGIHEWVREDKTDSWSWQSHPIWQSVGDIVNVASIELVAEGQGDVRLTMTALDGTTNAITITLANPGFPERFRENFAIQGQYLQLRIEADSHVPRYGAAPTVYSVALFPFTEQPIGHTL